MLTASVSALRKTTNASASPSTRSAASSIDIGLTAYRVFLTMRGTPDASPGAGRTTRGAALRLRPSHLPLSVCACCSIFAVACRIEIGQAFPSPLPRSKWSPLVWTAISVRSRYFSLLSVMVADTAASLRRRSRWDNRFVINCRTGGVISTCRPVISSRIIYSFQLPAVSFQPAAFRSRKLEAGSWKRACDRSKEHFPLIRRRDLQLFAVFRDRAAREHQPFLLENADDLRVAQRLPRVFVFNDLADPLLDRDRRDALAKRAADPAVEKVFQFEHALWRVHVLVVDDAADG